MKQGLGGLSLLLIVSCSPSPAAVQASAPAPATSPVAEQPAAPTPQVSRADALIEDLRRREAAQAKLDREAPPPPAPRLEDLVRPAAAAAAASAPSTTAPASASPERDEQWWKNEMRTAQARLQNSVARWEASVDEMRTAQHCYSARRSRCQEKFNRASADANRYKTDSDNDRAAIDRLREDARRASVPASWLRWP
jgi:hypothetical protein